MISEAGTRATALREAGVRKWALKMLYFDRSLKEHMFRIQKTQEIVSFLIKKTSFMFSKRKKIFVFSKRRETNFSCSETERKQVSCSAKEENKFHVQ
jgi:hypothetical protein